MASTSPLGIDLERYKWGFHDSQDKYVFKARKGLDAAVVNQISHMKGEPDWMRAFRLHAYEHFTRRPIPQWGADLNQIDFNDIYYYLKPTEGKGRTWEEVPAEIKRTFDRLGIPEAEKKYLAGVGAQYESESVYHNLKEEWEKLGVIFLDTDSALKQYPDLVREYLGTVVPPEDNKLAALNSAVWSGGSFVYVPAGVHVDIPLQAYFRINAEKAGQFERTMIICEPGSYVHYVEGCTAPIYVTDSLHSAVVEIIVKEGARCRYTTIQNWSTNTYNLVTKRAVAYRDATMEWIDGNIGCLTGDSKVLLNNDVRPISDVEAGDTVYSVDGELNLTRHKVVAKKYSGKQRGFRLRGENYREIRATANHPFLTLSKRGKHVALGWKHLDQLKIGDFVAIAGDVPDSGVPKNLDPVPPRGRKRITVPSVSTEELLWVLGVYTGDGYLDRARVYFAVPPQDKSHSKLVELLHALFGVDVDVYGNTVRVNSVHLRDFIAAVGFTGNASQKRIPAWVYRLPKAQRLAFIEGYISADGYRRPHPPHPSITRVNRQPPA